MNRPSPRSPGRPAALSLALSLALGLLVAPAAQAIPADLQPAPATPTPPTAPEAPAAPEAPTAAEAAPADIPAGSAFTASLSLRVDDREKALQRAVELTRERGGWFASLQSDRVSLRVPTAEARGLVEALRQEGEVFDRSYQSADLSGERADLESRLKARQGVLARYMEVLSTATAESVVAVEREITRVVAEIEGIQGRIRVLDDRAAYAHIDVSFVFRERRAPTRDGRSSFAWLRGMNMADLMRDLQAGRRAARSAASAVAPIGFSPYRRPRHFQAVSADDTIYRVRSVRNEPEADLKFWREALRTRQVEAGYRLIADSKIESDGQEGYLIELSGANGERDQAYLIAIFVKGRRIVIAEATGEAEQVAKQRESIIGAMQQLQL